MFQKSEGQLSRRFLKEALPLISTYLSGESVDQSGLSISVGKSSDPESEEFGQYIRFRHAIALCNELIPTVQKIENALSSLNNTTRTETRGVIRGRLDIPRYVAKKSSSFSWPRSYPIIVSTETPCTPENELVVRVFKTVLQRLPISLFPENSSEALLGKRYKNWILRRMKKDPWVSVHCSSPLTRLYMEASRRIARRQTGNEAAYSRLVQLIKDFSLVGDEYSGSPASDSFIDSLLSFPADQSFFDRIYEIWCIRSVAECLTQLGGRLIDGPRKMTENRSRPIYSFEFGSTQINIWFQSALPNQEAEWFYDSTNRPLRGIPDITLIANDTHRIIIDAKNRIVTSSTRSEETYKMLGYFENFRNTIHTDANWGILAFISFNGFSRSIKSKNGRLLELLSANPASPSDCSFVTDMKTILRQWIERVCEIDKEHRSSTFNSVNLR